MRPDRPQLCHYRYQQDTGQIVLLDFGALRLSSRNSTEAFWKREVASVCEDRAAITEAALEFGYFQHENMPKHRLLLADLISRACEPLRNQGAYDFAMSELAERLRNAGCRSRFPAHATGQYLERHGLPIVPDDLAGHNLLDFGYTRTLKGWPFIVKGSSHLVTPQGNLTASDGEALRQLAVAGTGLARLDEFQVVDDIASGRLLPVLQPFNPGDIDPVHAVFLGQGTQMPVRVRVFLDYLVANVRLKRLETLI